MRMTLDELINAMEPQARKDKALISKCVDGLTEYAAELRQKAGDAGKEQISALRRLVSVVMSLYILHEADVSKFVESADEIIQRNKDSRKSKLQLIRKARGLTQQQLSEASGVSLRMIQLYEQKQYELAKAQAGIVLDLAKVLGCDAADLIQG